MGILIKIAKKTGIFLYDVLTDQLAVQARELKKAERIQEQKGFSNLSENELIEMGKKASNDTVRAIKKELAERKSDDNCEKIEKAMSYGSYKDIYREGFFLSEDDTIKIRITKCTDSIMDFELIIEPPFEKYSTDGYGAKFLGQSKTLYSDFQYTLTFTWYGDDEFTLSGNVPWLKDKINVNFYRA